MYFSSVRLCHMEIGFDFKGMFMEDSNAFFPL